MKFPETVEGEPTVAAFDYSHDSYPEHMPVRLKPEAEAIILTKGLDGTYNVWHVAQYAGKWSESGSHYSHSSEYGMALIQATYAATN